MSTRPTVTDADRRARLVARHHLAGTADDPVAVVRSVAALHSSDPTTPPLACWARIPEFAVEDLERVLYDTRTLWRLHAMRRTLFVVPTDEAPVFDAGAAADLAAKERRRVERWLAAELEDPTVAGWLSRVEARLLEVLADQRERSTRELTAEIPELATQITLGSGKWATRSPVSSRLLFLLAMEGRIVRTRPAGSWRSSQYRWATVDGWFGRPLERIDPEQGRAELARRYLATHGPVTVDDVRWWTGWTAAQTQHALTTVAPVEVDLEAGRVGLVLPDDVPTTAHEPELPQVALLPGLDPTPMGWKHRDWCVGTHPDQLFDGNGNAGPTVWVDGRAVGAWAQRPDGEVAVRLLEPVASEAAARIEEKTATLTAWLDGLVVATRFPTRLSRDLAG